MPSIRTQKKQKCEWVIYRICACARLPDLTDEAKRLRRLEREEERDCGEDRESADESSNKLLC
jgi:hypothetical protein